MSGHTPGPWRVDEFDEWLFISAPIDGSELRSKVAKLAGPSVAVDVAANARLIAAAPDMLAALVALVNSFEKHRPKEYWDAARAAIARATVSA